MNLINIIYHRDHPLVVYVHKWVAAGIPEGQVAEAISLCHREVSTVIHLHSSQNHDHTLPRVLLLVRQIH